MVGLKPLASVKNRSKNPFKSPAFVQRDFDVVVVALGHRALNSTIWHDLQAGAH